MTSHRKPGQPRSFICCVPLFLLPKNWEQIGVQRDILDSPLYFPIIPLMPRAVEISIRARHNVFDCLYVALAEREGCDLATADEKLVKNLQPIFSFIKSLTTFP
ncbi:type II toxin-antitoxin system VapC family toxin [Singulisphaera rosea]